MIKKINALLSLTFFKNERDAIFIFLLMLLFQTAATQGAEDRYLMRFPDIHETKVVFVYGNDIWKASTMGGIAQRLTIHDGAEQYPQFSPDGSLIAFTGEYDGNADVYVMNEHGGDIRRLTFHPGYDRVVGWHPLENKIVFSSMRHSYEYFNKLFLISPDGTALEELVVHEASQGSYSPDGTRLAFNKIGRESRTWKRYKGGMAQDIFIIDFKTLEEKQITSYEGTDRVPMWIGDKIYFTSDRDRTLNIYRYDTDSEKIEQLTTHTAYDVRRPSMDDNQIIYELGGTLWVLNVESGENKKLDIEIRADAPETRPYIKEVQGAVTDYESSATGKRALIVARGEIFSVPSKEGITMNLSNSSGSREKDATWSPDGKHIAYFSDKNGEYELYMMNTQGTEVVQLTKHNDGYRHTIRWSPDSKKLAFADQTLRCFYYDLDKKQTIEVDKADYENIDVSLDLKPIYDFAWSPDSRFIAYSKMDSDLVNKIYIYSLEKNESHCVSYGLFNDFHPVFSKDGKYLLFVSNRRFDPTFCDFEWEMVYKKMAGIYSMALTADTAPFIPFKNEQEVGEIQQKAETKNKAEITDNAQARVAIDFKGIENRVEALPIGRGNYRNLAVTDSKLFYLNKDEGDFNRFEFRAIGPRDLYAYDFESKEEKVVIKGINGYHLSADGSTILYQKGDTIGMIPSDATDSEGKEISLADLRMYLDPITEWKQMFREAWRLERDFYYEPNMHGQDWDRLRDKYAKLLDKASCRSDVTYIIGELISELNTSHTYVFGGDHTRKAKSVNIGLLGATYEADQNANRYRFKKIYRVTDYSGDVVPPLSLPGMNVEEGDYILRVNGNDIFADQNIYRYFVDLANKHVTLTINDKPGLNGSREIVVKPLSNDRDLIYQDWLEHNRKVVEEASNGQIGYLHFPDTYTGSATEFPKYFYSQTRKQGLIIDARHNGGGLDPDIFLNRLNKKPHSYWTRRYSHDQSSPAYAVMAHMVCLTDKHAGSGGDEFPYEFQWKKMGPVVGTRTWGGLVGISMWLTLVDGGGITAPDYRIYSTDGKWVVENEGVTPDIPVDLTTKEMSRGYDAQLMKGVEILMQKIKQEPVAWPAHPPYPIDK
ncbi:PD40 domain-containing protein [candidate division KSB1 bacterium]|nr:PD40 domain-containing protein [candidate division KSB1 bacterium]